MAEYRLTYTADGKIKKELDYKYTIFSLTMIPDEHGSTSDKKGFEFQVAEKFPNEDEYVLEILRDLSFADEDEIEEILNTLSAEERGRRYI